MASQSPSESAHSGTPAIRHLPLLLALFLVTPVLTLHFTLLPHLLRPAPSPEAPPVPAPPQEPKPDFSDIDSVPERKSIFFDYIQAYVEHNNQQLLLLREQLLADTLPPEELLILADLYRVKVGEPAEMREKLLKKVDALPLSLVLAQAALESAWGTSRFAAVGNNFFGQWCFVPGCGLVPDRRHQGLSHEVTVFETPQESVASYMRNLNSHPAYKYLRERRSELRARNEALNGCYLAQGLTQYSAKGSVYVEDLKQLIRTNRLESDPRGYCAPVLARKDPPSPAAEPVMSEPTSNPTATPASSPATPPTPAPPPQPLAAEQDHQPVPSPAPQVAL
ncbi:MAG TPA: glucosaminidase domain-containing protein [Dongiaceae bacterium]|nr:glucosaminidase domain-containing protein [Dongiaceae bacterium]